MKNELGALMLWIDRKLNRNQDVLVTKIDSIQNLFETSAEATALSTDVLEGKTAYNGTTLITGTMENQGAKEATLLAGGTYNIPRGYHDGAGRVTATDLASQTPGTAGAGGILSGLKAWVAGKLIDGSMKDRRGTTVDAGTVTQDDEYTYLSIPEEACFDSNSKVRTPNSNIKLKKVCIGSTHSIADKTFNLKSYPGWQLFTNDNFGFSAPNFIYMGQNVAGAGELYGQHSYNPNTGILTVYKNCRGTEQVAGITTGYYVYLYYVAAD